MMPESFSISILFFAIYLITILCLLRVARKIAPAMIVCGSALFVYIISFGFIEWKSLRINFFSYSSLYWFLTMSFLMIFGALLKSISLKMMLNILQQSSRSASYNMILESYIKDQSYSNRIEILISKCLIEKTADQSFKLTRKGNSFAKKLTIVQKLFSIKESG